MAEILHQLRLVVYPIIYRVSYILGGAGFQPSTVSLLVGLEDPRRSGRISKVTRKTKGYYFESSGLNWSENLLGKVMTAIPCHCRPVDLGSHLKMSRFVAMAPTTFRPSSRPVL